MAETKVDWKENSKVIAARTFAMDVGVAGNDFEQDYQLAYDIARFRGGIEDEQMDFHSFGWEIDEDLLIVEWFRGSFTIRWLSAIS